MLGTLLRVRRPTRVRSSRQLRVVVLLFLAGAVVPGVAVARVPPPSISSVAEYVETFPTSAGGTATAPGAKVSVHGTVAQEIHQSGGNDAAALSSLVASGPKAARIPPAKVAKPHPTHSEPVVVEASVPSFTSAASAWGSVLRGRTLGIVIALVVLSVMLAAFRRGRA